MMKRILHKLKLILIGALIAGLNRVAQELEEYLEREQSQMEEQLAGEQGGDESCRIR